MNPSCIPITVLVSLLPLYLYRAFVLLLVWNKWLGWPCMNVVKLLSGTWLFDTIRLTFINWLCFFFMETTNVLNVRCFHKRCMCVDTTQSPTITTD
jgi:hypothetical protein